MASVEKRVCSFEIMIKNMACSWSFSTFNQEFILRQCVYYTPYFSFKLVKHFNIFYNLVLSKKQKVANLGSVGVFYRFAKMIEVVDGIENFLYL